MSKGNKGNTTPANQTEQNQSADFLENSLHTEGEQNAPGLTPGAQMQITPESIELFEKLRKTLEEQSKVIKEQSAVIEELKSSKLAPSAHNSSEISALEDYLDEPVIFFAYSDYFSIIDDFRNNKISRNPLTSETGKPKIVDFKRAYRWQQKQNGKTVVVSVSQYTCRSKAESEWLTNHTLYGIKFFRSMKGAVSVDAELAEKMSTAASRVGAMNDHDVIQRCMQRNIGLTENISQMRRELITALAKDMLGDDQRLIKLQQERAKKSAEQKDIKEVKLPS